MSEMKSEERAEALAMYLTQCFDTPDETRQFVQSFDSQLWKKVEQLKSLDGLAREVVRTLERARRVDQEFFEHLVKELPGREVETRGHQRSWQKIVLFLAAEPEGAEPLDVQREAEAIRAELARGRLGHEIGLVVRRRVTRGDWRRLVEDLRPHVVHFSGHGTIGGRTVLEDEVGDGVDLPPTPMLDQLARVGVRGVFLNACYSDRLADAVSKRGLWAVGMVGKVRDDVAIRFAAGFYEAFVRGEAPAEAFAWSVNEVPRWEALPKPAEPRFLPPQPARAGRLTKEGSSREGSPPVAAERGPSSERAAPSAYAAGERMLERFLAARAHLPNEVRRFLRKLNLDASLKHGLSPALEADDAVNILRRSGHLDATAIDALRSTFPGFSMEIDQISATFGFPVTPPAPLEQPAPDDIRAYVASHPRCVVRLRGHGQELEGEADALVINAPPHWLVDNAARAEAEIAWPLEDVATEVSKSSREVRLIGQCTPATAIRAGHIFRHVTGIRTFVLAYGREWPLDHVEEVVPLVETFDKAGGKGLALLLSISRGVRQQYETWADAHEARIDVLEYKGPEGRDPRTCMTEAGEPLAWARQIAAGVFVRRPDVGKPLHVFAALPTPLAVAVGRELNKLGPVTLYDLDPADHRYKPSFSFRA